MHQTELVAQQNRLAEDETVYNFKVKKDLKAQFVETAKRHDSDGSKQLRAFMRWFVAQGGGDTAPVLPASPTTPAPKEA